MPSRTQLLRRAALSYRMDSESHKSTNDQRWGGKLYLYKGADRERRLDDKDNKFAIVHPDQKPASYAQWHALLYKDGMDKATRQKIVMDTVAANWSHVGSKGFYGNETDCRWLAEHECSISPWDSAHYEGQRKLPPKAHKVASSKVGGAAIKKPADEAHRQGKHFSHLGAPKKTPRATYNAGRTLGSVSEQLKNGAHKLASAKDRAANPQAYLPAHMSDRGKGERGQNCWVLLVDAADACTIVKLEHDHLTGAESVSPVSGIANRSIVEHVRGLKNKGASLEQVQEWGQGMRALLGRTDGVPSDMLAMVAEARAAALEATWPARDAMLNAPSALEAKVAARAAVEAAVRGELDDDGADADDEAEGPTPTPRGGPPLPDSDEDGEEEWQDPATDGHAAAADALKAMVATYLSEWGGDARADAVGADIGAMFDAREL